jgi:hypothetical protein
LICFWRWCCCLTQLENVGRSVGSPENGAHQSDL